MIFLSLFFISFLSATLVPMGSEAVLAYHILDNQNIYLLIMFATLGNVLGSCFNYYLGLKGEEYLEKKNYLKKDSIEKYRVKFKRYGGFSLLLSWVPIIGDPLTFIAGVLRYSFKKFLLIVFVAKLGRYIFIAYTTTLF